MKIFILGWIVLALLWHLPNIIVGLFTSPVQAIVGLVVIGLMVNGILYSKS